MKSLALLLLLPSSLSFLPPLPLSRSPAASGLHGVLSPITDRLPWEKERVKGSEARRMRLEGTLVGGRAETPHGLSHGGSAVCTETRS